LKGYCVYGRLLYAKPPWDLCLDELVCTRLAGLVSVLEEADDELCLGIEANILFNPPLTLCVVGL